MAVDDGFGVFESVFDFDILDDFSDDLVPELDEFAGFVNGEILVTNLKYISDLFLVVDVETLENGLLVFVCDDYWVYFVYHVF